MIDYKKYRWFFTKSGKLVVGGKSAESNDALLRDLKEMNKDLMVMHTQDPGSPFCIIFAPIETLTKSDFRECGTFTGCFSKAWKEGKKKTKISLFKLSQLNKDSNMKIGTWNVKGKIIEGFEELKLVLTMQNKILRAVPEKSADEKDMIAFVYPGKIDKTKVKIDSLGVSREELISALPAGGVKIVKK